MRHRGGSKGQGGVQTSQATRSQPAPRRKLGVAMLSAMVAFVAACTLVNAPADPIVVACLVAADCGVSTDCRSFSCVDGACATTDAKRGEACTSGACDGAGTCVPPTCSDEAKNGAETGVDCGGGECPVCANGEPCADTTDCASRLCSEKLCKACTMEADCAALGDAVCVEGVCRPRKKNGEACGEALECSSGLCVEGVCCNVDCPSGACGGCKLEGKVGTCSFLPAGSAPLAGFACLPGLTCDGAYATCQQCTSGGDCATGNCVDGFCCNTPCAGGCERCDVPGFEGTCATVPAGTAGKGCGSHACSGFSNVCVGICFGEFDCLDGANCFPFTQQCLPAAVAGACTTPHQCASFSCTDGMCDAPSCNDGQKNKYESDVDCGGVNCAKCGQGRACGRNQDCESGSCADGVCCNLPCDGPCSACSMKKGALLDGFCASLEGKTCQDGWACTAAGTCVAGSCVIPAEPPGAVVYLEEDFSGAAPGWTLGPEWQIGSAVESLSFIVDGESPMLLNDPADDHSVTSDNRVAGVLLGGLVSTAVPHDFYWLTSPAIDVSKAPTVSLEFWRWLTSDYPDFVTNRIEVFDGSAWQIVWEQQKPMSMSDVFGGLIRDRAWTHVKHDLTPWKNAKLQVRFGYKIGQTGAYPLGMWNLDDVRIASAPCGSGS